MSPLTMVIFYSYVSLPEAKHLNFIPVYLLDSSIRRTTKQFDNQKDGWIRKVAKIWCLHRDKPSGGIAGRTVHRSTLRLLWAMENGPVVDELPQKNISDGHYRLISTTHPTIILCSSTMFNQNCRLILGGLFASAHIATGSAYHDIHLYPNVSSILVINQLAWQKRETTLVDDVDDIDN